MKMELLKAFANLTIPERKIIDYLYNNHNFVGNYMALTLELRERVDYNSNVRKALLHLIEICVVSKSKVVIGGRTLRNVFSYYLSEDWEENLIKNGSDFKKYYGRAGKPAV